MVKLKSCLHYLKLAFGFEVNESDQAYSVEIPAMHSDARDACPLINTYKQKFLLSRLPQTISGGVRFAGVASSGVICQGVLWCLPVIISSILDILDNYVRSTDIIGIVFGILMFTLGLITHLLVDMKCRTHGPAESPEINKISSLQEEDEIIIKSVSELLSFLFPERKHRAYIFLDPLVYGLLCGLTFVVTSPHNLDEMGYPTGIVVLVYILTWLSSSTALFSLISRPAPEVSVFRSDDPLGTNHLYRALYLLLLSLTALLVFHSGYWWSDAQFLDIIQYTWYSPVREFLYITICSTSMLWLTGVLPPIDCLYSWGLEVVLVVFLGGSPQGNDIRLTLQFLMSIICLLIIYVLKITNTSTLYAITLFGAFLSSDIFGMLDGLKEGARMRWKRLGLLGVSVVVCVVLVTVVCEVQKPVVLNSQTFTILQYLLLALYILTIVIEQLQQVYLLGLVYNPLHRDIWNWSPVRYTLQFLHLFLTPLLLLYLLLYIIHFESSTKEYNNEFVAAVMMFRCTRLVWQNTRDSLEECAVFIIVLLSASTIDLPHTTLLFISGLAVRVFKQSCKRLLTMATLFLTFLTVKKQRRTSTPWIITSNIILLPITLGICLFSVVVGAPILPLFSLPLFVLSFPRPLRFWPSTTQGTYSSSDDTSYYQQVSPQIMSSLTFHTQPQPGSFYLVRIENLLLVVQILEGGYGHYSCVVKGLELQETSCHTEEAGVIKDIFDQAFGTPGRYNAHYFNMLTPSMRTTVKTYSDARNVLTGVLDRPDVLLSIKPNFLKSLIYLIMKYYNNIPGTLFYPVEEQHAKHTGFDFSAIKQFKSQSNRMTSIEMIEDTDTMPRDDTSIESGNSWVDDDVDDVIINKTAVSSSRPSRLDSSKISSLKRNSSLRDSSFCSQGNKFSEEETILPEGEDWLNLPFSHTTLTRTSSVFPKKFYEECRSYFEFSSLVTSNMSVVPGVNDVHAALVLAISAVVEGDMRSNLTPYQVVKNYKGKFEWNSHLNWLDSNPSLKDITIKAYRYAVKLSIDECVYGAPVDNQELIDNLKELEEQWYVGLETDRAWSECVQESKNCLFSLSINEEGQYTSRMLTMSTLPMNVGSLNSESVRLLWASLALELFYLTNDDEERYSIQAHPYFMRNITIQAADLPLGYPIYQSPLLSS